jgi:hypothetical protein
VNNVKFNFLDWRPDLDPWEHEGLVYAIDTIHDRNGYRSLKINTALAFSTATPLSGNTAITDIKVKPFGIGTDRAVALINRITVTTSALRIGVEGQGAMTSVTLGTLASLNSCWIESFDLAQFGQQVAIGAQAGASLAAGGTTTYALGGTFVYTLTSV